MYFLCLIKLKLTSVEIKWKRLEKCIFRIMHMGCMNHIQNLMEQQPNCVYVFTAIPHFMILVVKKYLVKATQNIQNQHLNTFKKTKLACFPYSLFTVITSRQHISFMFYDFSFIYVYGYTKNIKRTCTVNPSLKSVFLSLISGP